jgi:O-antigen/teichoic acid export membrane protein
MEKKRLVINLFTNIISYSTIILIAFFLTPYLIRTVGKDAYSFYPLVNNIVSYMSIITVALNSMAIRFITIELVRNNLRKANTYFVSVLYSNIMLACLLLVLMFFVIIFLEELLNIPDVLIPSVKILFTLVFLSMLINIIGSVFEIAVFAKNRMDLRSLIEIIQGIQRATLYIIFFTFFKPSIVYIGVVTISLSAVYFISHFIFTKRLLPELSLSFRYFNRKAINEILPSGIWNSVNQLGALLLSSLSLLICNILLVLGLPGNIPSFCGYPLVLAESYQCYRLFLCL